MWRPKTSESVFTPSGASLWGPLKELWETVDGAVLRRQPESVHLLDLQLKKHKPHFLSLFKNPVRWHLKHCNFSHMQVTGVFFFQCVACSYNLSSETLILTASCLLFIFSQKVQSKERKCVKPAQKASPSKVSRGHGSFQNSFWQRLSSSVISLTLESWQLWSFSWQVTWTEKIPNFIQHRLIPFHLIGKVAL